MNILAKLPTWSAPREEPQVSPDFRIEGGRALIGDDVVETTIEVNGGKIGALGEHGGPRLRLDATGLMVLPGIVDIHGDAFERQMEPRPAVAFPIDIALM